jgi:hypothetical protein
MLRIATVVVFVAVLIAVAGIVSANGGLLSGGPSAIAGLFDGSFNHMVACTGGCIGRP